jgi:hypothetical protein
VQAQLFDTRNTGMYHENGGGAFRIDIFGDASEHKGAIRGYSNQ